MFNKNTSNIVFMMKKAKVNMCQILNDDAPVKGVVAITKFLFRSFPLFLSNINFTFANLSKNI